MVTVAAELCFSARFVVCEGKGGGQQGKQPGEAAAGTQPLVVQQETAVPASKSRKERQLAKKRPAQQVNTTRSLTLSFCLLLV